MVGLNNSTFLTSVLDVVGMSASRFGRINPKWRPLGHYGSWCIIGDAWRKNCVLAEKRARLFSWKQITSVNYIDSHFKTADLQPAAALKPSQGVQITLSPVSEFYVLLTVHLGIILVNNQLDAHFFSVYVYFDTLYVSSNHVLIIGRTDFINTTSGICHST